MTAGLYPGRQEIAIDVFIHMEQVFDIAYFIDAINAIFGDLGPAQAMFGAAAELPNVSALLDALSSTLAFDMAISTGVKVENILSFFSGGVDPTASLFFRLNNIGVFAEAVVASVDLDIFPGISVEGGNFLLSAGVRVAAPFEAEVSVDGSMASQISFSSSLSVMDFTPYGRLSASLPFEATVNGFTQNLTVKFEDDNLFDFVQLSVKVDFPVCPVAPIIEGLLGKLGSLEFSPRRILGSVELAGLDLADTLDSYFPDLDQYVDGILEGKQLH